MRGRTKEETSGKRRDFTTARGAILTHTLPVDLVLPLRNALQRLGTEASERSTSVMAIRMTPEAQTSWRLMGQLGIKPSGGHSNPDDYTAEFP